MSEPGRKTINKYHDIIESGIFTEQQIISFRSFLREHLAHPNHEEIDALYDKFDRLAPYELTSEQREKGLNWLYKFFLRKDGKVRETKEVAEVRLRAGYKFDRIITCLDNIKFTGRYKSYMLEGLINNPNSSVFAPPDLHPIYKLIDIHNYGFEYSYINGEMHLFDVF